MIKVTSQRILAALVAACALGDVHVRGDVGIIARRSAVLHGSIEGSIQVLAEDASVALEQGASIRGNLLLPADQPTLVPDGKSVPLKHGVGDALKPSSRLVLANRAGVGAVKGVQRAVSTFELPKIEPARQPSGSRTVELKEAKDVATDFVSLKDLVVGTKTGETVVPPGAYGDFTIRGGKLVLGVPGAQSRYDFQRFTIENGAEVVFRGPVLLCVTQSVRVQGSLGESGRPQWLDLRVYGDNVTLGAKSLLHAFVTAPNSLVTIGAGSELYGNLVCDRVELAATARVFHVQPDWSPRQRDGSGPLFMHKALRVQGRYADLQRELPGHFQTHLSYDGERPSLTISETFPQTHRLAQAQERAAFFGGARALLECTEFSEAEIVMLRAGTTKLSEGEKLRTILTREQFEDAVWAIAREPDLRAGVLRIGASPLLLNLFMLRCQNVAGASWNKR